jgi:hypothetical protein
MAHVTASAQAMVDCYRTPDIGSPTVPLPAQDCPAARPSVSRTVSAILALAIAALCALNMIHAYQLGSQSRMYDNPIYRWRESLVIALSRMQPQPLHGYVGYGSILGYLAQHGLALLSGEASPMPSAAVRSALIADGARMNRLMQEASRVAIDPALPPVILQGNELGLVDYTYWAFKLYGISINALVLFYFTLLFVAVALFFVTFRHSRFCLLLLMLYLAGHYFALDYAQTRTIAAIQNSRFFPVLALLPALYLLLLIVTRSALTPTVLATAAIQVFILMFIVFCRTQTYWEVLAVLLVAAVTSGLRPIRQALFHPSRLLAVIGRTTYETWPAVVTIAGVAALLAYSHFAPDESLYSKESKAHIFWHDLFVSTVSADPELLAIYGHGLSTYTDDMAYTAAVHDLRGRNDGTSPIASESDGVLDIDVMRSNGIYDREMRALYFRVVREHPWLVLRSFLIGKPKDQLEFFGVTPELWNWRNYLMPILLALAATLLVFILGAPTPTLRTAWLGTVSCGVVIACSTLTSFFFPTSLIPEVLTTWLMILLLCVFYLPLGLLFYSLRRDRQAAGLY